MLTVWILTEQRKIKHQAGNMLKVLLCSLVYQLCVHVQENTWMCRMLRPYHRPAVA